MAGRRRSPLPTLSPWCEQRRPGRSTWKPYSPSIDGRRCVCIHAPVGRARGTVRWAARCCSREENLGPDASTHTETRRTAQPGTRVSGPHRTVNHSWRCCNYSPTTFPNRHSQPKPMSYKCFGAPAAPAQPSLDPPRSRTPHQPARTQPRRCGRHLHLRLPYLPLLSVHLPLRLLINQLAQDDDRRFEERGEIEAAQRDLQLAPIGGRISGCGARCRPRARWRRRTRRGIGPMRGRRGGLRRLVG